ncbi:MAG: glycosyltransferase family 39 protein [Candidatus Aenigmatarchaeota archaeon]|nr:glycosyltransferase family 39 protein [Candidatus Aenigmarchaeota archaeon]
MLSEKNKHILLLILILVLGSILRLQNLNKDYQRDESRFLEAVINFNNKGTLTYNEKSIGENLITVFDHHPPLYIIYLSNIVKIFGTNIVIVRFFTVIFSIFSIVFVYLIGSSYGKKEIGLLAAFLISINRIHVEYSQQIDIDGSFLTFLILASSYFFIRWLDKKEKKYYFLTAIFTTLSLLTKITSIAWFVSLIVFLIYKKKQKEGFNFAILVFALTFTSLLIFGIYHNINYFYSVINHIFKNVSEKTQTNILWKIYEFFGIITWEFTPSVLLIFALSSLYFVKKSIDHNFIFIFLYGLPHIAILGITRYFVPIIPFIIIISSVYLNKNINFKRKKSQIFALCLLLFSILYFLKIRTDVVFLKDIRNNIVFISIPYMLTLLSFVLLKFKKDLFFVYILALIISLNIYFSIEAVNPIFTPRFYKSIEISSDLIKSIENNTPIITSHDISFKCGIKFYESDIYLRYSNFTEFYNKNKNFYVIDYRTNSFLEDKTREFLDNKCYRYSYKDKNVEILIIYKC